MIFEDTFEGTAIDSAKWSYWNEGVVSQHDGKLWFTLGTWGWIISYTHELAGASVEVEVTDFELDGNVTLYVFDYSDAKDSYTFGKNRGEWLVTRTLNWGSLQIIARGPWNSSTGKLKIKLRNSDIIFYEDNIERYREQYQLPTTVLNVAILSASWSGGGYTAVDNLKAWIEPTDPCQGVQCPTGQHCVNGVCVADNGNGTNIQWIVPALFIGLVVGIGVYGFWRHRK